MRKRSVVGVGVVVMSAVIWCGSVHAQAADPPPPPLWDAQVGASFVGTSGNTSSSSTGIDFAAHRRGRDWQIDSTATTIRTSGDGQTSAARYLGNAAVQRSISKRVRLSAGERAERDTLSGLAYRNVLDAGLAWALVRSPLWTLDGTTSAGWSHEQETTGTDVDDTVGVFQVVSRLPLGAAGDTTQRFAYFPDFTHEMSYRTEAEIAVQASLNGHLALKMGYLVRYANAPVAGFKRTDNTATASVVVRFKARAPAPGGS